MLGSALTPEPFCGANGPAAFPLAAMLPVSPEARERMSRELEQAGWAIRVGEYLFLRFVSACTAALSGVFLVAYFHMDVLPLRVAAVIALFFSGWLLPHLYLSRRRQRRLEQIEKQLPDALTTMVKSLRAGTGLLQAWLMPPTRRRRLSALNFKVPFGTCSWALRQRTCLVLSRSASGGRTSTLR